MRNVSQTVSASMTRRVDTVISGWRAHPYYAKINRQYGALSAEELARQQEDIFKACQGPDGRRAALVYLADAGIPMKHIYVNIKLGEDDRTQTEHAVVIRLTQLETDVAPRVATAVPTKASPLMPTVFEHVEALAKPQPAATSSQSVTGMFMDPFALSPA